MRRSIATAILLFGCTDPEPIRCGEGGTLVDDEFCVYGASATTPCPPELPTRTVYVDAIVCSRDTARPPASVCGMIDCTLADAGSDAAPPMRAPRGGECEIDGDCADSLVCTDRICCDSRCETACKSCKVAGSEGTCSNVKVGTPDQRCAGLCNVTRYQLTPEGVCVHSTPFPLDQADRCDGAGACKPCPEAPDTVTCDAAACLEIKPGTCDDTFAPMCIRPEGGELATPYTVVSAGRCNSGGELEGHLRSDDDRVLGLAAENPGGVRIEPLGESMVECAVLDLTVPLEMENLDVSSVAVLMGRAVAGCDLSEPSPPSGSVPTVAVLFGANLVLDERVDLEVTDTREYRFASISSTEVDTIYVCRVPGGGADAINLDAVRINHTCE